MILLCVVQSKRKSNEITGGNLVKDAPTVSESLTGPYSGAKFGSVTMIVRRLPLIGHMSMRGFGSRFAGFAFRFWCIGALCLSRTFL